MVEGIEMSVDWLDGAKAGTLRPADRLRQFMRRIRRATAGAHDGMSAVLAKQTGSEALYLSGAALSASMALPDPGPLTPEDVARRARDHAA